MEQLKAVEEFKKENGDFIEQKVKENLIDDITTAWDKHAVKLLRDGQINDREFMRWRTPNFETQSYVQAKIAEGAIAIKQAMQQGKRKAVLMHVQPCILHKAFNPPPRRIREFTMELLSPGAKEVYEHFIIENYTITFHATHDGGGLREWFNMTAHW